jgi:hypothetical protein
MSSELLLDAGDSPSVAPPIIFGLVDLVGC